jgi:hypothetical protein
MVLYKNMDWSTRRKLTFFIALFIICIGIIALFAIPFFNRPATCSDNKQNGAEVGVDCGGSCRYLCKEQVSPLKTVWSRSVASGPKRVVAVAYIRNENKTAGVQRAPYKFTVLDNEGKVISIREGETEIPANGNIAVVTTQIDIGERKVQSTIFEWTAPLYFSSLSEEALASNLQTINTKIEKGEVSTHLTATMKNTTRLSYRDIPVVAILYDKNDNTILASRTILDELGQEETGDVYFSWNLPLTEEVTRIEIIPYFKQFAE